MPTLLAVVSGDVSSGITYLFTGVLVAMILCLAFEEKLHAKKSVIVGFFAVVVLFLGQVFDFLPQGDVEVVVGAHTLKLPIYIPGIDWNVIAIISAPASSSTSPRNPASLHGSPSN